MAELVLKIIAALCLFFIILPGLLGYIVESFMSVFMISIYLLFGYFLCTIIIDDKSKNKG